VIHLAACLDLGEIAHAAQQRLAMRGVPRERRAISSAPSWLGIDLEQTATNA
jgi:hypothetical protein